MAYRLVFHYLPGRSLLHRWDARCKLPALLAVSMGLLSMSFQGLIPLTVLLAAAIWYSGIPLAKAAGEMKAWAWFLLLVFILQAIGSQCQESEAGPLGLFALSEESVLLAAQACWRLALMLGFAIVFTCTTRSRELQQAILWYLRPLPFIPSRRIALMMALTLRFLPLLLDQLEDVRMAVRSRLGEQRRNPLVRARCYALPLLRKSLIKADDMALALAARGYREDIPILHPEKLRMSHVVPLLVLIATIALLSCWWRLPALSGRI